jgi:hypothetical protein
MKTLKLITQYLKQINEQDGAPDMPDATDISEQPVPETPIPLTSEGEKFLINLAVKAFLHIPDDSESKIVNELQSLILNDKPKEVIETIENFLEISPVDTQRELDKITDIGS